MARRPYPPPMHPLWTLYRDRVRKHWSYYRAKILEKRQAMVKHFRDLENTFTGPSLGNAYYYPTFIHILEDAIRIGDAGKLDPEVWASRIDPDYGRDDAAPYGEGATVPLTAQEWTWTAQQDAYRFVVDTLIAGPSEQRTL